MAKKPESHDNSASRQYPLAFLSGGGEMGKLVVSMDWSKTPLGPISSWPQSLRTTVGLCLASNFPISLIWGPKHNQIYNDGYWPLCGGKHPGSMGQDFSECWASAWPVIGEAFNRALAGETSYLENQRMFLDRNGYLEETFFTFSFSPIRDESGGIGGLFHPVTETTSQMLVERRTRAVRDLADRAGKAKSMEDIFTQSALTLAGYDLDLPFVLIYALDDQGKQLRLVGNAGLGADTVASPVAMELDAAHAPWPWKQVVSSGVALQVDDVPARLRGIPCGPYPEPPNTALLLPITAPGAPRPAGILIAAVSPRLPLNDVYLGFFDQLAATVTAALANALAYEEERKRAEALAEIDRGKTAFFSNVSHEFRTPLTLMLGPLEDAMASRDCLSPVAHESLEVVHRNALRLLRLVNTLLDFSRIEAGRIEAVYEPTDLDVLTADLASTFRSAIERAGMTLEIDCPPLSDLAYLDRDMWEKIVLNLLSNAFKFTLQGGIKVKLSQTDGTAVLTVADTGIGIEAEELPHLFERFHRVKGAKGRTFEGTGIGLALVHELIKLHGGNLSVESAPGRGSTFIVSIPLGSAHLPADRIAAPRTLTSTTMGAAPFVEEALHWLPGGQHPDEAEHGADRAAGRTELRLESRAVSGPRPRVLLADDNADMRNYVRRLLEEVYDVQAVADGDAALEAALADPPDLVLSDIMMPGLDGFELLHALRKGPETSTIPVILLSARAGEESRVDGMEAGADDYLTKPFSAKELLARVRAHLEMARVRREAEKMRLLAEEKLLLARHAEELRESEQRFRNIFELSTDMICLADINGYFRLINSAFEKTLGYSPQELMGKPFLEFVHPEDREKTLRVIDETLQRGETLISFENRYLHRDGTVVWLEWTSQPFAEGQTIAIARNVTERKRTEDQLRKNAERLADVLEAQRAIAGESLEYPSLLQLIVDRMSSLTGADGACLEIAEGDVMVYQAATGLAAGFVGLRLKSAGSLSGLCLTSGELKSSDDIETDPRVDREACRRIGLRSMMLIPLQYDQSSFGVLKLMSPRPAAFDAEAEQRLRMMGEFLGVTVARKLAEEARKRADEIIKASLHEKEVLLREIHHRVKNNLQVISSLVRLQSAGSTDEKVRDVLKDVSYRVRSMALVHEKLYQSHDLAKIDFAEYIRSLLSYLWKAHGTMAAAIRLTLDLATVSLPVDTAVPCGLILNELAGNALKHAFPGRGEGEVTVMLHMDGQSRILLCVRDDGVGLPPELDWRNAGTLGLRLVQMLAGQLSAMVELKRDGGTEFCITFKLPEAAKGKQAHG